jgi:hypothetical protein
VELPGAAAEIARHIFQTGVPGFAFARFRSNPQISILSFTVYPEINSDEPVTLTWVTSGIVGASLRCRHSQSYPRLCHPDHSRKSESLISCGRLVLV